MDIPTTNFVRAGSLDQLKTEGRLIVHGPHRPILVIYAQQRVFAFDNRCPHMGFPLDRGSVEDGILTCHWHHARFDLASGCTFDLWADDVPTCPVEVRGSEVWVKPTFGYADPAAHWRQRLHDGLAHNLGLVIAKAVQGELMAGVPPAGAVRQIVLFSAHHGDGWGVGLTILTALGNLLPVLPEEETYLALFHGARRVAADCEGQAPRRERAPLASHPDLATLKRWLRRWTAVRHREAAERTVLTAIAAGASPAALADLLLDAEADRTFAAADTRSTSSTRPSSALISSAGSRVAKCCRPWWARWWPHAAPRNRPLGVNRRILSFFARKRRRNCQTYSPPVVVAGAGRIMRRSPICSSATMRPRSWLH
jgi:nitrite reductase/ring-hydroxylating ferredoxin subunit